MIPNRFSDGYGVSPTLLERIDADVIITVDNGITALEAAKICKERGIDLLITDHHTPLSSLPEAYSIVDPKLPQCEYPFKEICGAEVIWLVLALLKQALGVNVNMRGFVDLLCLAIIADIMPLVDINRALVKDGLKALMHSSRAASVIIRDFLNKSTISSEDIAFMIAPRLNSAGRLEDASLALEFLTAKTTYEAYEAFEYLGELNQKRKEIEQNATEEAIAMIEGCADDVLVVAKENWHEGVVGIVASRLTERFNKPSIVLSINGEDAKGSARSIEGVDIFALIKENAAFLTKFGGHKMAAGLGLKTKDIAAFKEAINASAAKLEKKQKPLFSECVGEIALGEIDFELLEILEAFEPYGEANPRPKFLLKNAKVVQTNSFGTQKNHTRFCVQKDHQEQTFVAFWCEDTDKEELTCSYSVVKNEYNGNVQLQLVVGKIY